MKRWNKANISLIVGGLLLAVGIGFILYAFNHPELYVHVPVIGTKGFYRLYLIIMAGCLLYGIIGKLQRHQQ